MSNKSMKYRLLRIVNVSDDLDREGASVSVVIPSVFSAVRIVRESNFSRHTQQLVSNHNTIGRSYIYDHKNHFSFRHASVELFVAGPSPTDCELESFYSTAAEYGIKRSQIVFSDNNLVTGIAALESDMVKELYNASEQRQVVLSDSIKRLDDSLALYRAQDDLCDAVAREVMVQYPTVTRVVLGKARTLSSAAGAQSASRFVVLVETTAPLVQAELDKLQSWLRVRLDQKQVSVIQSSPSK